MNPSCTEESKFIKLNRIPINVTTKHEMQKSAKLRNTQNSFTNIVMRTIQGISLTEAQSPPYLISSMVPSFTVAPRNSLKPPEAVQMYKQEQFTQEC